MEGVPPSVIAKTLACQARFHRRRYFCWSAGVARRLAAPPAPMGSLHTHRSISVRVALSRFTPSREERDFGGAIRVPAEVNLFFVTIVYFFLGSSYSRSCITPVPVFGEPAMRAFFPSIVVCSAIFLAPCAYGNTLQPGPVGSAPTDKSFFLTFGRDGSADARSYVVDHKGFYEHDSWSRSGHTQIGVFNAGEASGSKGISPENISLNAFHSRGASEGTGSSSLGGGGSFGSSGGANGGVGASLSGGGLFSLKGPEEGVGFVGANKGSGLFSLLPNSGSNGSFGLGSEGGGPKGLGDPSVSATPLPASWTMMLIGLVFGLLVWLRKSNSSATRENGKPPAAA